MEEEKIIEFLEKHKLKHYCGADDNFYNCPLSENPPLSEYDISNQCNCGADKFNFEIDEFIKELNG